MNIRKIVLSEDGFKGAEIHYYNEKEKNGRQMLVLTKEYPNNPIHFGLEKMFKDLRLPRPLQVSMARNVQVLIPWLSHPARMKFQGALFCKLYQGLFKGLKM